MSIRFAIKNNIPQAEKEGNEIVRFSGAAEPFRRSSERESKVVGVDGGGNPKLVFTTGLDEKKVQFYRWYDEEEQKVVTKTIKELRPLIEDYFGGKEVLEQSNKFFWKDTREVSLLKITNEDMDIFFDTKNPVSALLYLSIIGGAFIDLVAPTKDWADRYQIPHYLMLESESGDYEDDTDITRSDAHTALGELRKEAGNEALFILGWCMQFETNSFGAYTYSTPQKQLINYHIQYIDGKLQTKKKRNCPKTFLDYAERWKGQQTRPQLYTEAYVKAGEYYALINQREKKYTTADGVILGNTITEAVTNLHKPKFQAEYEKLRDAVEAKWKE